MALEISRILHAGYVFACDGVQIALDPIFENPFSINCRAFPDVLFDRDQIRQLRFSAVFISHFHDDHCSLESLDLLDRSTPIYVFCAFEELRAWIRELGFDEVHALQIDVPVSVGPFDVIPRRALDADVDCMFHIKAAGLDVLDVVDAWIDPSTLRALGERWDMVLWPFQTMREIEVLSPSRAPAASRALPEEWLEQLAALKPRYVVPSSCQFELEPWSWYNQAFFPISYRQFQLEIESLLPESRVVRLDPSTSVVLDASRLEVAPSLRWMEPVGEQDVDYEYDPRVVPPPTSEIARRFAPLGADRTQRVLEYCRSGLLERYRSLDPPSEGYFEKPRHWRLSLHDHAGEVTHFFYALDRGDIALAGDAPISWSTDVPLSKLYAALELGESLTSMYVRINDARFTAAIEAELATADVLEDPLIRCLFDGVFGAYQRAQLRRLGWPRASIARAIGAREPEPTLPFEVVSAHPREGYDELLIQYSSGPERIPAYLLMPTGSRASRSLPAVVAMHQHASEWHLGKSEVAGLAGSPLQAFGPPLARQGIVVLAPDSICFEDRRANRRGIEPGAGNSDWLQHYNAMAHRLLRGELLMRRVLEDAMAAVSVLLGIDAVDGDRIGALGHSYGGNTVLFHAAIDARVRFACASGAACSYRDKIEQGVGIEMSMIIPGFAAKHDVEDLLRAISPRPLLLVSGEIDPYSRDAPDLERRAAAEHITHLRDAGPHAMTSARFERIVEWVTAQVALGSAL